MKNEEISNFEFIEIKRYTIPVYIMYICIILVMHFTYLTMKSYTSFSKTAYLYLTLSIFFVTMSKNKLNNIILLFNSVLGAPIFIRTLFREPTRACSDAIGGIHSVLWYLLILSSRLRTVLSSVAQIG